LPRQEAETKPTIYESDPTPDRIFISASFRITLAIPLKIKRRAQTGLAHERVVALALFRWTSLAPDLAVPNAVSIAVW